MAEDHLSAEVRLFCIAELVEHIISYLWCDKQSLESCSLVCSTWASYTARHLFVSLALEPPRHFRSETVPARYKPKYVLARARPRVRHNIRKLSIDFACGLASLEQDVVAVLICFPYLRAVYLDGRCSFILPSSSPLTPLLPLQLDILSLRIRNETFKYVSPAAICNLFTSIGALELQFGDTYFHNFSVHGARDRHAQGSATAWTVRSLILKSVQGRSHATAALKLISSSLDCSQLDTLTLDDYVVGRNAEDAVDEILRVYDVGIKTFALIVKPHNDGIYAVYLPCASSLFL